MDHLCGYLFTLFSDRFNGWLTRFLQIGWKRAMALSLSLMLWLGSTLPVLAAGAEAPLPEMAAPTPSRSGLDANAISSEKINQFVRAYLQVVGLIEQRESDLQSTETESEFLQMQREVQAQALELIEAEGLTLQEYLQLLSLANIDPEFSERVAAQLQEAAELL
jgi:hypothetical protein